MTYDELMAFVKRDVDNGKRQWSLFFDAYTWEETDIVYDAVRFESDGTVEKVAARINGHEAVIRIDHDTQDFAPVAEWLRQYI